MSPHEQPRTPDSNAVPIYTIGYGNRELDEFLDTLQAHGIAYLIDVRTAPYSRYKPEFSKSSLQNGLEKKGIRYVYMGDLLGGQPDDPACYVDGKVDYSRVVHTQFYIKGLQRLQDAYAQQLRVALMCSEGKPENCHRAKLIGESLDALSIPVRHIDEAGQLKSQEQIVFLLTNGQLNLFGKEEFTSRKRYQNTDEGDDPFGTMSSPSDQ